VDVGQFCHLMAKLGSIHGQEAKNNGQVHIILVYVPITCGNPPHSPVNTLASKTFHPELD
jgi:hypothetical protein